MANYSYDFASGGVVKVDVDPQWMEIIGGFDRAEHANDEYNRRLSIKLGNETQHEPDPCEIVCRAESLTELLKKLGTLTDRQREVLAMRYIGLSGREIARRLGVDERVVRQIAQQIQKKVSQGYPQTP